MQEGCEDVGVVDLDGKLDEEVLVSEAGLLESSNSVS